MSHHVWIKARICEIIHSETTISYQGVVDQFASHLFDLVIHVLADMYIEDHIRSSNGNVSFRSDGSSCYQDTSEKMRKIILEYVQDNTKK